MNVNPHRDDAPDNRMTGASKRNLVVASICLLVLGLLAIFFLMPNLSKPKRDNQTTITIAERTLDNCKSMLQAEHAIDETVTEHACSIGDVSCVLTLEPGESGVAIFSLGLCRGVYKGVDLICVFTSANGEFSCTEM